MEWILLAIGLVVGAGLGAGLAHARAQARTAALAAELRAKTEELAPLESLRADNERLRIEAARGDSERAVATERVQWVERPRSRCARHSLPLPRTR